MRNLISYWIKKIELRLFLLFLLAKFTKRIMKGVIYMIIPNSVTFMIFGFIGGITGLYFGLNYIINKVEKWIES